MLMVGKNFIVKDSKEDGPVKTNRHCISLLDSISKRLYIQEKDTVTILKEVLFWQKHSSPSNDSS